MSTPNAAKKVGVAPLIPFFDENGNSSLPALKFKSPALPVETQPPTTEKVDCSTTSHPDCIVPNVPAPSNKSGKPQAVSGGGPKAAVVQNPKPKFAVPTADKSREFRHTGAGAAPKDLRSVPKSNFLIDNVPGEQVQLSGSLIAKFGGNREEAEAYAKLNPFPNKKFYGANPSAYPQANADYQAKIEKSDVKVLRQEMREKEVAREMKEYQKMGIPLPAVLARLQQEGKIEGGAGSDLENAKWIHWPKQGELPIQPKVKDDWDVPKAQKRTESENGRLLALPTENKQDGSDKRTSAFMDKTQRLRVYNTWSQQMQKNHGWDQGQCDAVIGKMHQKYSFNETAPAEVAGYFFQNPQDLSGVKTPSLNGQPIRFDNQLPKGEAKDPLTQAAIESHQATVKATPEAKLEQGRAAVIPIQGKRVEAQAAQGKKDHAVSPPELKGEEKWVKRYGELLNKAKQHYDQKFAEQGLVPLAKKDGGPEGQGAWKLPGAGRIEQEDPQMNQALSLERNRMRKQKFADPQIQEYQDQHAGRSIEAIQASKPSRQEFEAYKKALDGEVQQMRAQGFSEAETKEYQRQHPNRKADQIGKAFSTSDANGTGVAKTREDMRQKLLSETAQALKKIDPNLSDENASLMAGQLYWERTQGSSDEKSSNLDGMLTARKGVQDDLHLISENPKLGSSKLKDRAASHEVLGYYGSAREMVKGDKAVEKFFGETDSGQENLELYAASRGIYMGDPAQVAGLRKEISKEKLGTFSKNYAEAPKGGVQNHARAALKDKYSKSSSGNETRKKPDLRGFNPKERSDKEWQLYMQEVGQDWKTINDEKQHQWTKTENAENRDFQLKSKKTDMENQLALTILNHEMSKDKTLSDAVLNLGIEQLKAITKGLNDAHHTILQAMNQLTAQLVLAGAPPSGKDIVLSMLSPGRSAKNA